MAALMALLVANGKFTPDLEDKTCGFVIDGQPQYGWGGLELDGRMQP